MAKKIKSIEEQIEDWCKKQFKGEKYYTKTESVNSEIECALEKAPSKVVQEKIIRTQIYIDFGQRT